MELQPVDWIERNDSVQGYDNEGVTPSTTATPAHAHNVPNDIQKREATVYIEDGESGKHLLKNHAHIVSYTGINTNETEGSPPSYHNDLFPRETWGKKMDFLLSIIGYAVDLANVWRFPYLCYRNGGGAFLIPYFACLLLGALPLFFVELVLGQFHREGAISVWKICPLFKGAGLAVCWMAYIVAFYYNVVIGWSFFYLFQSFTSPLPWMTCNNSWNSENCWQIDWNFSDYNVFNNMTYDNLTSVSSTQEYYERGMLQMHKSGGIDDLGEVNWKLALSTLLTFTFLYLGLWKGVKSSGKVVWVTATMPYVILTILLIRGLMLPGAGKGIAYFITPRVDQLGNAQAWIEAAVQVFFSMGAGFGAHIAFASYNKYNNNCYRDCLITAAVNSGTSIFSGFVIFSYLGYMSEKTGNNIKNVAIEGPGLIFIVYPEAISTLPGSSFWSVIFFFMMLMLGIDSAMGGLESALTGLKDEYRKFFSKMKYSREVLTLVVVLTAFLFALPCTTNGGIYVFNLLNHYAAGTSLLFAVLAQAICIGWFYGVEQFCSDVKTMLGFIPGIYWRLCWKFFSPLLLLIVVVTSFVESPPLTYESSVMPGVYKYPTYAYVLAWELAASSMLMIPIYAVYRVCKTRGTLRQKIALCISPEWEHEYIRRTRDVRRFKLQHWIKV